MKIGDMFSDSIPEKHRIGEVDAKVVDMWRQAAGELLGFANALERGNAGITAVQLRWAVQLANRYVDSTAFDETEPS